MSQIAFVNINNEWTDITTLGNLSVDNSYFIQNRGSWCLLALESSTEPETEAGTIVNPYKVFKFKQSSDKLWVKTIEGSCSINISEA